MGRHAPVVRFDARELFHPIAVDGYVANSSLWHDDAQLAAPASLTDLDWSLGAASYLHFVSDSERHSVVGNAARLTARQLLSPRLGRVGLFGRLIDASALLSIWFRPTVPRWTTAAARLKSERLGLEEGTPVCYGRVFPEGEWLVLHYFYFYAMNDWRTSYRGLNDHEGDWEQAFVYLDPADLEPVWVAATSHDHHGGDLRRHWSDPELEVIDGKPVLHASAGSHALYFSAGDYVTRVDVPEMRWAVRFQRWFQRVFRIKSEAELRGLGPALGAPFVDYATGDGREIAEWDVREITSEDSWMWSYRGLWGVDVADPVGAERGPSGPKFDKSGRIRDSWADPLAFAGLQGVLPPSAQANRINLDKLKQTIGELDEDIKASGRRLPLINQSVAANDPESAELTRLMGERMALEDLQRRLEDDGPLPIDDCRAHLQHPAVPLAPPNESGWALALWAAMSVPLIVFCLAALFLLHVDSPSRLAGSLAAMVAAVVVIEQLVHRRWAAVARLAALIAATVALVVFFSEVVSNGTYMVGALLALAGVVLLISNLGELVAVQKYRKRRQVRRGNRPRKA